MSETQMLDFVVVAVSPEGTSEPDLALPAADVDRVLHASDWLGNPPAQLTRHIGIAPSEDAHRIVILRGNPPAAFTVAGMLTTRRVEAERVLPLPSKLLASAARWWFSAIIADGGPRPLVVLRAESLRRGMPVSSGGGE